MVRCSLERYFSSGGHTAVETGSGASALSALSAGAERSVAGSTVAEGLQAVADAVRAATGAEAAVVRVAERGALRVRAISAQAPLAAELEGLQVADPLPESACQGAGTLPAGLRALAERVGASEVLSLPVRVGGTVVATLELLRRVGELGADDRETARAACAHVALVLRAFETPAPARSPVPPLQLAADALAAGADPGRAAERIAHLVVDATRADACLLWGADLGDGPPLLALAGALEPDLKRALAGAVTARRGQDELEPVGTFIVASASLGPQLGVLQVVYRADDPPPADEHAALATFASRAALALRAGERAGDLRRELDRTRDLLSVAGQATAQLSLAHTLETALERIPDLIDVAAVGIYLRTDGRLDAAASRQITGPHAIVAERLLHLAIGPFRARGQVATADAAADRHLEDVRAQVAEAGIEAAHAVPLVAHNDVIGLLVAYPPRGRSLSPDQSSLLAALAGQIAVAVQNAQLHEKTSKLGSERKEALVAERIARDRVSALYEISRSFAQSMSLDRTLDAVGRTLVELLDVDAAVIRLPDERGESLVAQAVHVASPQLRAAIEAVFGAPEEIVPSPARRRLAAGIPVRLDEAAAKELGRGHDLLAPFLERGSTAAVVPIATPSELLATLTLVSLDPGRPLTEETLDTALSVAGHAALAVDNARLYQQQKQFTDSMQRSLLPRTRPRIPGLDLGAVYESSALVGVGGDVYDYLQIDDDRLAIVLGDVTGHGIDAAADMAMAKFVFRSLARLYPEPGPFLSAANEVVLEEIGAGKFITMLYLTINLARGEVACASAGHPAPRLVRADGTVERLDVNGLALGVEAGQSYGELHRSFEPGAAVVLFTDGVVEARRRGELFGEERLDQVLADRHELPPDSLAESVLQECRRHVGGELRDDCAIVVVRRRS